MMKIESESKRTFIGKHLKILQKDKFFKEGLCTGLDDKFLFLKYSDGTTVAVAVDAILEIKFKEDEEGKKNV